jgi:hypothetical protein
MVDQEVRVSKHVQQEIDTSVYAKGGIYCEMHISAREISHALEMVGSS